MPWHLTDPRWVHVRHGGLLGACQGALGTAGGLQPGVKLAGGQVGSGAGAWSPDPSWDSASQWTAEGEAGSALDLGEHKAPARPCRLWSAACGHSEGPSPAQLTAAWGRGGTFSGSVGGAAPRASPDPEAGTRAPPGRSAFGGPEGGLFLGWGRGLHASLSSQGQQAGVYPQMCQCHLLQVPASPQRGPLLPSWVVLGMWPVWVSASLPPPRQAGLRRPFPLRNPSPFSTPPSPTPPPQSLQTSMSLPFPFLAEKPHLEG